VDLKTLLLGFLLYGLFPLWLLAGVADYFCHRRTRIEATSGVRESRLHVLQALQLGMAIFSGLFLEINALVLAIIVLAVLAHSLTSFWDTAYSAPRRYISPFEQHVHSHLDVIPVMAASIVVLLHWETFPASFALQWKSNPIPANYLTAVISAILIFEGLPLCEEFVRARRFEIARK
jgi:hypothetical protein